MAVNPDKPDGKTKLGSYEGRPCNLVGGVGSGCDPRAVYGAHLRCP